MASTITGFFKVFYKNYLIRYLPSIVATSNSSLAPNIADNDKTVGWTSSGSDDSTTETITITFPSTQNINRIVLILMNFKEFNIQYSTDDVTYSDFTGVYSKKADSVASDISYTTNSETTRYFEFTAVDVKYLKINVTKTMVVDAEKSIKEVYVGTEIGTFLSDLTSSPNKYDPMTRFGEINIEMSNLSLVNILKGNKYKAKVKLKQIWDANDQNILNTMYDEKEFAISPCGADGTLYTVRKWRLQDFYSVLLKGDDDGMFSIGRVEDIGLDYQFELYEQ